MSVGVAGGHLAGAAAVVNGAEYCVHVVHSLHDVDLARGGPRAVGATATAVGGAVAGKHPEGGPDALTACTRMDTGSGNRSKGQGLLKGHEPHVLLPRWGCCWQAS